MGVLVLKISFYNCAENKRTNSYLVHERMGEEMGPRSPGQEEGTVLPELGGGREEVG